MNVDPNGLNLLAGCDESQQAAITSDAAPLLVVAGAGSGKTRVLTRRIAWRVAHDSATCGGTLALTFTRKAASELRERLAGLGLPAPVTAGTFHGVALAQLRQRALDRGRPLPVVVESKARLLAAVVPEWRNRGTGKGSLDRRELLRSIATEIEWAKARCIAPEEYVKLASAANRSAVIDLPAVATAFESYESERRKRRVYDFDDLLTTLADTIDRDPDFAAAQRWRFRHLFVDELQDANAAQLRLLDAWLGGRPDLFCVGDARQAIYGWNGADPSAVTSFVARYQGATVLELRANYRSTPQVVSFSGSMLDRNDRSPTTTRSDGHVPTITAYPDDDEESIGVARELRRSHRLGRRWKDCAVLARTNAQLVAIERALVAAGVPYRQSGAEQFLTRPAVRHALDDLATSAPQNAAQGSGFRSWARELEFEVVGTGGLGARPVIDDDSDEGENQHEALLSDDLAALARLATEYCGIDPAPSRDGFLIYLRHSLRTDPSPLASDAVELLTFHRAKGLEWPVVFVIGLEEGYAPISQAKGAAALGEERRLVYVALSRASDELHLSWARQRRFASRSVSRQPSPYLGPLEAERQALIRKAAVDPTVVRAAFAEGRALLSAGKRAGERPTRR